MLSSIDVVIARSRTVVAAVVLPIALAACAPVTRTSQPQQLSRSTNQTAKQPVAAAASAPKLRVATAADGVRIAYDVAGTGPALMLIHGGGQTRHSWQQLGYVDRLKNRFTVITLDLRGYGDSDKPLKPDAYKLETVLADLLAVADAAGAAKFHLWGFGHGATIGRYLAAQSDRVLGAVLVGATMGPTMTGILKDAVTGMRAKWQPLVDAHQAGKLDIQKLSASDRAAWESGVPVTALSLGAMIDYPALEPGELKTPTLWLVAADDSAAENAKGYEGKLTGTSVTLKVLGGMNYSDSFNRIDEMLKEVEPFLLKTTT
jgi:pimeloyl-ACP methyl ester carboxylesterase